MFQSIDRSIDPPEGSKDLVLLSRKVFGRQKKRENAKRREIRACNGDRLRTRLARFFRRDAGIYTEGRLVHRRAIARRVPLESTSRVVGGEIEAVLLISSMGR